MARRNGLILAALLVGLVSVVALASRAHSPTGSGGTHQVNAALALEYAMVGMLALAAVALPALLWFVWKNRSKDAPELPPRIKWMGRVLATMAVFSIVAAVYAIWHATHHHAQTTKPQKPGIGKLHSPQTPSVGKHPSPQFDWVPAIVVFTTVLGGTVAAIRLLSRRRVQGGPSKADLAEQLSDALDDSLDDLRAEADPRKAVIAAYARMERVLGVAGLPRHLAEAPVEYMTRVLRDLLRASAASVTRLTDLFEWAKFSRHDVDHGMKDEAIAALVAVRDELRAVAE
jgi:hypothetical protein